MFGKIVICPLLIFVSLFGINSTYAETLSIEEAIRLTLKDHPDAKIASALIVEAKGKRMSELSLPSPGIAIEYEGIPDGGGLSDYEEKRIAISQEFEFPIRYFWLTKAANIELELAKNESRALLLDLEVRVREAYLDAYIQTQLVDILKEMSQSSDSYADKIKRRYKIGETSRLDSKRAQLEALEIKGQFKSAQRAKEAAMFHLSSLTGVDQNRLDLTNPAEDCEIDKNRISEMNSFQSTSKMKLEEMPFRDSPETVSLCNELELTRNEKILSKTAWLPEMELSYFQQTAPEEENPDFWGVELGFNLPIWFWWGGIGDIQSTSAHARNVKEQLVAHYKEMLSEWQSLAQNLRSSMERFELYRDELLPLSQEAYELAGRSFDIGEADYFEVVDGQRSHLDVHLEFLEITAEFYNNQISLDRLEGRSIVDDQESLNSDNNGRKQ